MTNPILCLDFDGVIHDYKKGWQDGTIYGELTPGFLDWAHQAGKLFDLVIYSSRSKDYDQLSAMVGWIRRKANEEGWNDATMLDQPPNDVMLRLLHPKRADIIVLTFAHEKPPAFLTIDDRCVPFLGHWDRLTPDVLRQFKPWNAA